MPLEIERKFLLKNSDWKKFVSQRTHFKQGYLSADSQRAVRIRLQGNQGLLTIKGKVSERVRLEYEYPVPSQEAEEMLDRLCHQPVIDKHRHLVAVGEHTWEIDEFAGDNAGLVVAEIELSKPDEDFERPDWLGEEVTSDPRYINANLARHPYSQWS